MTIKIARPASALLLSLLLLAGCESPPPSASADASAGGNGENAASADATEENKIVAVVNGVEIPESRLQVYAQAGASAENRRQLIENIVTSELIAAEARKQGYDRRTEVREELVVAEQAVLGRAFASDLLENNVVDDAQIEKRYQEFKTEFAGQKEYSVAHILVEEEEQANELLKQIKADADSFAELAEEHSQDPGSAANGGALGWVQPQALVPAFADAMQALEAGGVSDAPVETTYGWHIIRVDETRAREAPPLNDEIRERISQVARAEVLNEAIEKLRQGAEIEIIGE